MSPSSTATSTSSRRAFLAAGAALGLAGCGFKLRQAPDFAFQSIAMPTNTAYLAQLKRAIDVTGKLTVKPMTEWEQADVVFDVLSETRDQLVLSTNSAGQVRELQLFLRVRFKLRTPQGKEVIPPSEMLQSRDITYNETAALAKESETQLLYRDMINDVVQQTIRRLGALKSL
ncbi:LPS assembly lipoprotein LptE [Variovorax sp. OV329]|uniref:LPS-assembly lipoprotein LptE n=1 Tax=Variovorax sp. OV329 TaxID=1882825 RepID=UPI0008EC946B|nr:LPS assembly lipoprotein LptE [Variovorax sp. OV329]SFM83376.1 LPS-assembly lipoprotein [Variovorax sp. OV329]